MNDELLHRLIQFRWNHPLSLGALLLLVLSACGGGDPVGEGTPRVVTSPQVAAPEQQRVEEAPIEEATVIAKPREYRYNPQGRRDPFRSILVTITAGTRLGDLPPLQRIEIVDMKLTAVVWGSLGYTAMVETPDGKNFNVRAGTLLGPNNGVIKRITQNSLRIKEEITDIFGAKKTRNIIMELHPQKEGSG